MTAAGAITIGTAQLAVTTLLRASLVMQRVRVPLRQSRGIKELEGKSPVGGIQPAPAGLTMVGTSSRHHAQSIEAIREAAARGAPPPAPCDFLPLSRGAECIRIVHACGRAAERGIEPSATARRLERHGFDAHESRCQRKLGRAQNIDLAIGTEAPTLVDRRSPESRAETLRVPLFFSA